MPKCKNCKYFRQPVNTSGRGECTNPVRNDDVMVHYFGSLKETDYCVEHTPIRAETESDDD